MPLSYVLDLRGNRGGVLEGAIGIGGYFMGRGSPGALPRAAGAVVPLPWAAALRSALFSGLTLRSATPPLERECPAVVNVVDGFGSGTLYRASEDRIVPAGAPVAVLVDRFSASSSEVLAGALRDSCRATVIGDGTYGKGVIQGVFGLRNGGAVVLTLAKYQSPSGAEINGIGVVPNVRTRLASSVLPPLLDRDLDFSIHAAADAQLRTAAVCPVQLTPSSSVASPGSAGNMLPT